MTLRTAYRTRPLMANFGVEIPDVDIASASPEVLAEIVRIFQHHGAVVLRDQRLDQMQQIRFTELFGEPAENSRPEFCDPEYPLIYIISNKVVNGRRIGDPDAGQGWHTDYSYAKTPGLATMLYALEVPEEGSNTMLADLCAVWDALPAERQRQLDGLVVQHSFAALREYRNIPTTEAERAMYPDVFHPLVRRHPKDGRKALWVSTGTVRGIVGMPNPQGLDLLKELVAFATQDRFVYSHKWRVGDVLVWDNRCTLHRGTPFDRDKYIRHVRRTWVRGEIPQ